MAQKVYRKLQFDSMEKNLDLATEDSISDNEEDEGNPSPIPAPPSVDHTSDSHTSDSQDAKRDPTVVVTRDYYGLAQTVGGNHSCLILVTNRSKSSELRDPVVFTKRGYTRIPPDSKIPPESSAYCAFRKPSIAIKGTSGVLSYEYDRKGTRSKRFAIMWKIPYRVINHEENEVGLKWMSVDTDDPIDSNMHTTMDLYREIANSDGSVKGGHISKEVAKNGKSLHLVNSEDGAELDATFSGNCKAIVKVDFSFLP